ncbi:MAG: ribosome biogenesis GTPase YlqF [Desulfarculaceae bacterium]|nr:ribosome biogenesis GTPase YlqF [Desulfarculaceae bacterium]
MSVQWFPGHMRESVKILKKAVNKANLVLEIMDARLPFSSTNPYTETICRHVAKIKVMNKSDLADPDVTAEWLSFYNEKLEEKTFAISALDSGDIRKLSEYCLSEIPINRAEKLKVIVMGIPNTGKSTLINSLAGKKVARVGNVPAVTRHNQRLCVGKRMDVYDTPGILWPVLEPAERGNILSASGAVSDSAYDYTDIGDFLARYLLHRYPGLLENRYGIDASACDGLEVLRLIGKKRGCLVKGGRIDLQKAAEIMVNEVRQGKTGRISFEKPDDITQLEESGAEKLSH